MRPTRCCCLEFFRTTNKNLRQQTNLRACCPSLPPNTAPLTCSSHQRCSSRQINSSPSQYHVFLFPRSRAKPKRSLFRWQAEPRDRSLRSFFRHTKRISPRACPSPRRPSPPSSPCTVRVLVAHDVLAIEPVLRRGDQGSKQTLPPRLPKKQNKKVDLCDDVTSVFVDVSLASPPESDKEPTNSEPKERGTSFSLTHTLLTVVSPSTHYHSGIYSPTKRAVRLGRCVENVCAQVALLRTNNS